MIKGFKKNRIYMDHASAAPLDSKVFVCMQEFLTSEYANPSALHEGGVVAKKAIDKSRKIIAKLIGAREDEIVFTSSGTESNNLAILGLKNTQIISTNIEHPSVLEPVKIQNHKFITVENNGIVLPSKIKDAITKKTTLVTIVYANNEIGTIQPIQEIVKAIRVKRKQFNTKTPYIHIDSTQAVNYLNINVEKLGIDLMTFNGSKIYGPKGVGVLYKRKNIKLNPLMYGGAQEYGLRPGTENVAGIVGIAKALEIVEKIKNKESGRLEKLRNYFLKKLRSIDYKIIINGDLVNRLPNNINISIEGIESDVLVLELNERGVEVSAKSACEKDVEGSYVIEAIRPGASHKGGSIRFSLGRSSTKNDVDYVIKVLKEILEKYKEFKTLLKI